MADNVDIIESTVEEEMALSFTELKEKTGLSNGVLQYHIHNSDSIMKKNGAIIYKNACEKCEYSQSCDSRCIRKELRKTKTKKILSMLNNGLSQAEIARELDLSRATINYHVDKLRDMRLVEA